MVLSTFEDKHIYEDISITDLFTHFTGPSLPLYIPKLSPYPSAKVKEEFLG